MLLHSPHEAEVALSQGLLPATGKCGASHHVCDVGATCCFVGFVPCLITALQIHKSVQEVKGAEEPPKKSEVSEYVRYAEPAAILASLEGSVTATSD